MSSSNSGEPLANDSSMIDATRLRASGMPPAEP
jgi:hypothetical protein